VTGPTDGVTPAADDATAATASVTADTAAVVPVHAADADDSSTVTPADLPATAPAVDLGALVSTLAEPTGSADDLEAARATFRARLLDDRVLVDLGRPGLYGRSRAFEHVMQAVRATWTAANADLEPDLLRFPPVITLPTFEQTDYIASFPDLAAAVSSFRGGDREHRELLAARAAGERWERFLEPADVMLTPAACHPVYALLSGQLPEGGRMFDVDGDSFRHEPSLDPMRLQAFHMHEFVHVGTPASARSHRDSHVEPMAELLRSFGLEIDVVPANDPFFGRVGKILARNQVAQSLKFEFITPVYGADQPWTAIASANLHEDHFGLAFGITTADGGTAHSACLAFGLERITLALFGVHGSDVDAWPAEARTALSL
jgi:hypothetical protein